MIFHRYENWQSYFIRYPVVTILGLTILITQCAAYLLGEGPADPETAYQFGALVSGNHASEEWFRLVTFLFLQMGGMYHLFWNMVCLMILGPPLERLLGHAKFLLLYLASGVGGGLFVLMFSDHIITAGASAGIYGLIGLYLGLIVQQNREVSGTDKNFIIILFLCSIASNVFQVNVSIAGSLGGLFTGFFLTSILYSTAFQKARYQRLHRSNMKVLAAFAIMFVVIVLPKYAYDHPLVNGVEDKLASINTFSTGKLAGINNTGVLSSEGRDIAEPVLTEDINELINQYSHHTLSLTDEAEFYIENNPDEFINHTAKSIEAVKAASIQADPDQIEHNLTAYLTSHLSFHGQVYHLEEFDYGDSIATYAIISKEKITGNTIRNDYYTVVMMGEAEQLNENDHVTIYGLPVGTFKVNQTSGDPVMSQFYLASYMEKRR